MRNCIDTIKVICSLDNLTVNLHLCMGSFSMCEIAINSIFFAYIKSKTNQGGLIYDYNNCQQQQW